MKPAGAARAKRAGVGASVGFLVAVDQFLACPPTARRAQELGRGRVRRRRRARADGGESRAALAAGASAAGRVGRGEPSSLRRGTARATTAGGSREQRQGASGAAQAVNFWVVPRHLTILHERMGRLERDHVRMNGAKPGVPLPARQRPRRRPPWRRVWRTSGACARSPASGDACLLAGVARGSTTTILFDALYAYAATLNAKHHVSSLMITSRACLPPALTATAPHGVRGVLPRRPDVLKRRRRATARRRKASPAPAFSAPRDSVSPPSPGRSARRFSFRLPVRLSAPLAERLGERPRLASSKAPSSRARPPGAVVFFASSRLRHAFSSPPRHEPTGLADAARFAASSTSPSSNESGSCTIRTRA